MRRPRVGRASSRASVKAAARRRRGAASAGPRRAWAAWAAWAAAEAAAARHGWGLMRRERRWFPNLTGEMDETDSEHESEDGDGPDE